MLNKVNIIDSIEGLKTLRDNSIDLVFTDPPYNIGINYGNGIYKDNLSHSEYMEWCQEWISLCIQKLKNTGSLYLMHYPHICAEWYSFILPQMKYRKWISWVYSSNIGHSKTNFTTAQRTILYFSKTDNFTFNALADPQPYKNLKDKRIQKLMEEGKEGITPYDWWDIPLVKNVSKEKTSWENQIPLALVERIVKISSNHGDIVLDPFMGSGTTAIAAYKNGRNYIGFDINPKSEIICQERMKNEAGEGAY